MSSPPPRKSLLGRAGPLVLARLLAAVLSVSIPLVLARAMDLAEYGTYKQLFLIAQTLGLMLPFGMAQALYYFLPRTDQSRAYVFNALAFVGLAGLASVALVVGCAGPAAHAFSNPALVGFRWPLALYILGLVGAYPLEIGLTSQGRTRAAALSYLVTDGVRAALMVAPVLAGFGLRGVMVSLAAFSLARMALTWGVLLKLSSGPLTRPGTWREQLAYAAPFGAAMVLARPSQSAHQYAVSAVTTPEAFAVYSVGCFQVPLVDLLYTPTSEVLMVEVGELEKRGRLEEAVNVFRDASAKLALLFFPLAAVLFAVAPEFIAAAFGPRFSGAVPVFRVSVLGVALSVLPLDGLLRARNLTRQIFLSYALKAGAAVPLVYLGVHWFGMMGGIVSYVLGEVVGKAFLLGYVSRALSTEKVKVGLREALPWRRLGQAGVAAVAAAAAVPLLRLSLPEAIVSLGQGLGKAAFLGRCVPLGLLSAAFLLAYAAGLWATGVRPQVLQALRTKSPKSPAPAL